MRRSKEKDEASEVRESLTPEPENESQKPELPEDASTWGDNKLREALKKRSLAIWVAKAQLLEMLVSGKKQKVWGKGRKKRSDNYKKGLPKAGCFLRIVRPMC